MIGFAQVRLASASRLTASGRQISYKCLVHFGLTNGTGGSLPRFFLHSLLGI